mmetsp:Transcript_78313/g.229498  ORF Transcript_78313/g.229498 Transcript_78313/m.229498 type:complete len:155 (+) Transcript_78313:136-600(+)
MMPLRLFGISLLLCVVLSLGEEHCLAQKHTAIKKVRMRVSAATGHDHQDAVAKEADDDAAGKRVLLQASVAQAEPNGPMRMNLTKMDQSTLPQASRHINGKTQTSDWFNEYEVPEPVVAPVENTTHSEARGTSTGVPLAVTMAMVATVAWLPRP